MKTKNLLSLLAIAGVMFFTSCKDDDIAPLSKEEAQSTLNTVDDSYISMMADYENSQGKLALDNFEEFSYSLPFYAPKKSPSQVDSYTNNIINKLKKSPQKLGDDPFIYFDFTANVGTYTYNTTTYEWDKSNTPTDKVVLVFPITIADVSKTVTATYYDYIPGSFSGESYTAGLKFKVEISGVTAPVYSWTYTSSQSFTSETATFEYTVGVYTRKVSVIGSYTVTSSKITGSVTISDMFKKSNEIVYSTSATISMVMSDTGDSALTINAQFQLMNIVIKWDINMTENTVETDPNNYMKMSVWTAGGAKVGDIKLVYSAQIQDWVPYIYFADGTNAPIEELLNEDLLNAIGDFMDLFMFFGEVGK